MTDGFTARLALPLLQTGQAQKEVTHNEALARLDFLAQPVVRAAGFVVPPAAPAIGDAWIVGPGATGAWTGRDAAIAAWTEGGWRFADPFDGMSAWSVTDGGTARYTLTGGWRIGAQAEPIADPAGGSVVDAEARGAIVAILHAMRVQGIITA